MARLDLLNKLTKFAYILETDKEEQIGWDYQMRGIQIIDQIDALTSNGGSGWVRMIRLKIIDQIHVNHLETDEGYGIELSDEGFSNY